MQSLYIYYAVPTAELAAVLPRVRAMVKAFSSTGIDARLMQKLDSERDNATLMEIYENLPDASAFERSLTNALCDAQLPATLIAQRHVERFEELPCA